MPSTPRLNTPAGALAAGLLIAGAIALWWVLQRDAGPVLDRVRAQGELVVATRQTPAIVYQGANGLDGFEHALTQRFAETLGVEIRYVYPKTVEALFNAIARGTVHMAAAGLTVTPARERFARFTEPYQFVTEQLVYRRGSTRPKTLDEIDAGDLHVIKGSSHEETLQQLRAAGYPELEWEGHPAIASEGLLAAVDQGDIRLTIADSNATALSQRIFRHTATAFELGDPRPIAWAFSANTDDSLLQTANRFLTSLEASGELRRLRARFFGHTERLNFVDVRDFWRQVRDRLPTLQPLFEQAAAKTGIDWRLLAAIGYQESHWRQDAVSPTGVRGIMMLTRATADQVGVEDRNDPQQSIMGGARYLRIVEKKIPDRIDPVNRLWFTLAGYNVGFGHLEDARILTERDGGNPDLWIDVKQRLPLLAQKKYYRTVRYGYARGSEPVNYVDNIRNYYDLLVWFTTTDDRETRARLLAAES